MISIESLLGMIATEVVEEMTADDYVWKSKNSNSRNEAELFPIPYNLELIERSDGSYEWIE